MAKCFEMVRIEVSARREIEPEEMSPWEGMDAFLELHPDAAGELDPILEGFNLNTDQFMYRSNNSFRQMNRFPWAIIAFDKEYPIGGYFCEIRGDPQTLSFTSYSVGSGWPAGKIPPVSCVVAWDKSAFQTAAKKGPELLGSAWDTLKDRPTHRHWFCIAGPLDDAWVQAHRDKPDQATIKPTFVPR